MKKYLFFLVATLGVCICFCKYNQVEAKESFAVLKNDTLPSQFLGKVENGQIIIDKTIDLKGGVCELPKGLTLIYKTGIIKNGTLIGNMTKLHGKEKLFDRITIKGSWDVPEISTKMFSDLSYENALKDVVALTHPEIQNTVIIDNGNYSVRALKDKDVCISLRDNTIFKLNGTISLVPNNYKTYYIIRARGKNIVINGNGDIIGDKQVHTDTGGEWGMGIDFRGAIDASVSGLTIRDCWGDCIYVGGNSKNIQIENCSLDHGRRQGISVTKADGVTIRNCKITNIGGTDPEYAIDVEPNAKDTVDNVLIENVIVKDCKGGFLAYKAMKPQETTIGNIVIRNCTLSVFNKYPICLKRSQSALVEKCFINVSSTKAAIKMDDVQQVNIRENTININNNSLSTVQKTVNKINKKNYRPIQVNNAIKKTLGSNIIIGM